MNYLETGRVLGIETYRETSEFVSSLALSGYGEITTRDLQVVWTAITLTVALALWHLLQILVGWRRERKLRIGKILWYMVQEALAFVLIIVVLVMINYRVLKVGEPKNVIAERVGENLVRVRWETYDPEVGIMLWGYDKDHVERVDMGNSGDMATRIHDVLLEIEPQREMFYYLVMKGEKFGSSEGEPYKVEVERGYKLEKIDTNE